MKDFACQAALRKKKKSLASCFKSFVLFLKKIVRLAVGLIASVLFLSVVAWLILPHMLSPQQNKNIVFINQQKGSQEREFLFAYFDFELDKTQAFLIEDDLELQLVDRNSLSMEPVIFQHKLAEFSPQHINSKHLSWLTGRVVEQVLVFDDTQTSVKNLPRLIREKLISHLSKFNFKNIPEIKELVFLLLLLRRGEYELVAQQRTILPITAVLPDNCSVAVINTTRIVGYASALTSILENSGARIIRVDSGYRDQDIEQTAVAFNRENSECHYTLQTLNNHLFLQKPRSLGEEETISLLNRFRADVVILLSDDQIFEH